MFIRRARRSLVAVIWLFLFAYVVLSYVVRDPPSWGTLPVVLGALYTADALSGVAHFLVDYTPSVSWRPHSPPQKRFRQHPSP